MTDNLSIPTLAVTMGDPSGVGPEVTMKALAGRSMSSVCRPVVVGDASTMARAAASAGLDVPIRPISDLHEATGRPGIVEVLDLRNVDWVTLKQGQVQAAAGDAAYQYVIRATELALAGHADAIVTAPLNKEALNLAGHHFAGHTELLAHLCGVASVTMLLAAGDFRVSHVSTHVALREATERVKTARILEVIELTHQAVRLMGVDQPRIAVAGLNPHAGEHGLFGDEEELEILPAIEEARQAGMIVTGPLPPDTVFLSLKNGTYDVVVAMYHDQGHIPTKMLAFDTGVNVTLGLPIIRTSVDHGTAFDIAGKGKAKPDSMVEAIKLAAKMAASRT